MQINSLFAILIIILCIQYTDAQVPDWYIENLEENVGIWRADNSMYRSDTEPFDFYEIEWKQTLSKYSITGKMFGIKENQRTDILWEFIQYWDYESNQAIVLQFDRSGIFGKGNLTEKAVDSTELIQKFYLSNSKIWVGHGTKHLQNAQIVKSFSILENDEWELNRTYIWLKIPSLGKLHKQQLYSEYLYNKINEPQTRDILIYTPPSYYFNQEKRYPVLYLLHSYGENSNSWKESPYTQGFSILSSMDSLVAANAIQEMIVVMPDCSNKFGGSWYTNSTSTGKWENFISFELVNYIDKKFRTISRSASRGIAGHSMGGYGALKIAMKRPDIFGSIYAMNSVNLSSDKIANMKYGDLMEKLSKGALLKDYTLFDKLIFSKSLAFVPNNRSPYYTNFLYYKKDDQLIRDEEVWECWSNHLLVSEVEEFKNRNLPLHIAIEHGTEDFLVSESRNFSRKLHEFNVRHSYSEYSGDHTNKFKIRFENYVLPFFSRNLKE